MEELKITKEKVLEAASTCSQAASVLKTLFPEAFVPPTPPEDRNPARHKTITQFIENGRMIVYIDPKTPIPEGRMFAITVFGLTDPKNIEINSFSPILLPHEKVVRR